MRCAVFNCNKNNNKIKPSVRFYSFPKNDVLRQQWVDFCQRKEINTKTARICSAHFSPNDFERNMQFEMGLCTKNGFRLKPHTVPTVPPKSKPIVASSRSNCTEHIAEPEIVTSLQVEILRSYDTPDMEEEILFEEIKEEDALISNSAYEELENPIVYLNNIIESLRQQNLKLLENEKRSRLKICALQKLLKKSELDRINMEDKLRDAFTKGQMETQSNVS